MGVVMVVRSSVWARSTPRGRNDDDAVDLAGHQRFDAFVLRMLLVADAEQQLLRIHVDDGFDFVKQLRAERSVAVGITSPMVLVTVLRNALAA